MNLKGTKTEKNLYKTFAGESRARNKYTMYAEKADLAGLIWIADIFRETAKNELAHARRVLSDFLGQVKDTENNLLDAIMGETEEFKSIYKNFEKDARNEGFIEIADFFKELQEVEEAHAERYKMLYNGLKDKTLLSGGSATSKWVCQNCGYIHEGPEAPKICPLCKFPQGYFKPYCTETKE